VKPRTDPVPDLVTLRTKTTSDETTAPGKARKAARKS
jgi:hypothetical protein